MVGVLVLHPEISSSSDSPYKARVVYVVLLIAITWRRTNEPTLEKPFFYSSKKKKKKVKSCGLHQMRLQIIELFETRQNFKANFQTMK